MRCESGASPRKLEKTSLENGSDLDGGEEWRLVDMVPCSGPVREKRMAGNDETTTNNEILGAEGGEEGQGTSARGELHSRVGGILECDPPGNRNSSNERPAATAAANNEDGVCRYAVGAANRAMSFFEMCQIRLQYLFPQLSPPPRYNIHDDSIESTAEILANDVMRYLLKEDIYLISQDPVSRSMRHNVYQMLNKHSILFTSMVNRLNVVPDTAYETFMGVANELFLHDVITWARIVCLYAFMGRLALWARDRRMHNLKKKLPLYVSRYVGENITHFIKGYGGWEQLCVEYPVAEEVSGAVWRSLLMTGATLGLIATILSVTS
ncbi:B2CL1 protein, partial [Acromyrmex heyeri]